MKHKGLAILVLKLMVTGGALGYFFYKADLEIFAIQLDNVELRWIYVSIFALFGQLLLTALRWHFVAHLIQTDIRLYLSIKLVLIGQFFNQVLPSSVGGDAIRAWMLSQEGISIKQAILSVICDRLIGLIFLTFIVACLLPVLIFFENLPIPSGWKISVVINFLVFGSLIILFFWGGRLYEYLSLRLWTRPIGVVLYSLRLVLYSKNKSFLVILLTILVQGILVASIYFFSLAFHIELTANQLMMLPVILLIASIPISFAGWGLREGAMIIGLGFVGLEASDALTISIGFGVGQMVIGMPGIIPMLSSNFRSNRSTTA